MRAFFACLVCAPPLALGVLAVGCSSRGDARVALAPSLLFPTGVLDNVKTLTLTVYDGSGAADCDGTTGKPTGITSDTAVVARPPPLGTSGCSAGVKFCGTIQIDESSSPRIFAAVAKDSSGNEIADGCAKKVVDQDQLAFTIVMIRNARPTVCGDGIVESTEQCDPPGSASDFQCDDTCHTKEEYLSAPGSMGSTVAGAPGEKVFPRFAWQPGSKSSARFVSLWEDRSPHPQSHVAMRVMNDALAPLDPMDLGQEAAQSSFFIPNDNGATAKFPPTPDPNDQGAPSIAFQGGKYWVAFQDDNKITTSSSGWDIHMRSMDAATFAPNEPYGQPLGINGLNGDGEGGEQFAPSVAASADGNLFIAWQDAAQLGQPGQIFGVGFDTQARSVFMNTFITQISQGTNNSTPAVAGLSSGWVVVWQSGTDIKLRFINSDGTAPAADQTVNNGLHHGIQDQPSIATIGDGRFAVVWADHGAAGGTDIIVQRYSNTGTLIADDQQFSVNTTTAGEQLKPSITGSLAHGGMYVVSWIDATTNHVRARYLGGSGGFLYNNVDGKDDDFQASIVDGHMRDHPTAAIGGAGQYVAIGWEDLDPSQPGIKARRFPVPP